MTEISGLSNGSNQSVFPDPPKSRLIWIIIGITFLTMVLVIGFCALVFVIKDLMRGEAEFVEIVHSETYGAVCGYMALVGDLKAQGWEGLGDGKIWVPVQERQFMETQFQLDQRRQAVLFEEWTFKHFLSFLYALGLPASERHTLPAKPGKYYFLCDEVAANGIDGARIEEVLDGEDCYGEEFEVIEIPNLLRDCIDIHGTTDMTEEGWKEILDELIKERYRCNIHAEPTFYETGER